MKARLVPAEEVERVGREAAARGDEPVFQLANEVMGFRNRPRGGEIVAESIVSAKDGQGRVKLSWHDELAFLDLEIARGLAQSISEAATAAQLDAQLYSALSKLGLPQDVIGGITVAVRAARRETDTRQPS